MKKWWLCCAVLIFFAGSNLCAQGRGFGLGIILGEPTGISAKQWLSPSRAFDFALAWSLEGSDSFIIHADYLKHTFRLIKVEKGRLPFYYGIGGRIKFDDHDDTAVGVRIPIGLTYLFAHVTLDLFVEIVPILQIYPDTDFRLNGALGLRYFF
ncbi:MAG: hypothetical protein ACE5IR_21625 [bacterium]